MGDESNHWTESRLQSIPELSNVIAGEAMNGCRVRVRQFAQTLLVFMIFRDTPLILFYPVMLLDKQVVR